MAVIVKLSNGTVKIGGDFDSARTSVKAFGGKFDWNTKTWNLTSKSIEDFCKGISLPIDILSHSTKQSGRYGSGSHITRYGNSYSQLEWEAQKAADKAMAQASSKHDDKVASAKQATRDYLESALKSFAPDNWQKIFNLIVNSFHGWENEVEAGRLAFRNDERKAEFSKIMAEYERLEGKLCDAYQAQSDAAEIARERVYEDYGIE